ncbi:MAG TPA: GNAT family N-acetyltransferase, partial [Herpetosiphonaceae bacterium]
ATLFGGDQSASRASGWLDPARDAAKIRAFFVHPARARQGIGRLLLDHCEAAAREHGFARFELMATLPGVPLYRALGYQPVEEIAYPAGDVAIPFVRMAKSAVPPG